MAEPHGERTAVGLASRGAAKRAVIVRVAADLMYVNGVAATSLPQVLTASSATESQFHRHFADKHDLVQAVIALRAEETLTRQTERLRDVTSLPDLRRWGNAFVERSALRSGAWGCELGSLSAELADTDEHSRARLAHHFIQWEDVLARALTRLRDNGALRPDTDTVRVATAVMAAIQGGYLLAQTAHDCAPMSTAIDMALSHIQAHAPSE